ncbi:MAG: DUF3945 domain-containing protein [Prevotellaceae bacterium]|jgi:hypothetical protein|nr:DUF3945 domain-containing protein [Prevotellaceae bacterium]
MAQNEKAAPHQAQAQEQRKQQGAKQEQDKLQGAKIDAQKNFLENFYQNFMRQYKRKPWISAEDLAKMLPELARHNISVEQLHEEKLLEQLVNGRVLNKMVPIVVQIDGQEVETQGKLQLSKNAKGEVAVKVFAKRHEPNLREYFGHQFTEKQVEHIKKTGTLGEVIEVQYPGSESKTPVLLKLDKDTNVFHAQRVENISIQSKFFGATLTDEQKARLMKGEAIKLKNMVSQKTGKPFYGNVQYDPQNKCLELVFTEQQKKEQFLPKSMGGKELTKQQQRDFAAGKTILVTDLMSKNGNLYHTYVTKNLVTQEWSHVNIAVNAKQSVRYQLCKEITDKYLQNNPLPKHQQSELDAGRMVVVEGAGLVDKMGKQFTAHIVKNAETNTLDYASFDYALFQKQAEQHKASVEKTEKNKLQTPAPQKQNSAKKKNEHSSKKQNSKKQNSAKKKAGIKM